MHPALSDGPVPKVQTRDRQKRSLELSMALNRLQKRGEKITIAAVAKEAGVTPALIHNRYPDFAEELRKLAGKATRSERDRKHELLMVEREKNRELRAEYDVLKNEYGNLASVNEALRAELRLLKATVEGMTTGKVAKLPPKNDR